MRMKSILCLCICLCLWCSCGVGEVDKDSAVISTEYTDLVKLFQEFRDYQKPEIVEGIPDYTEEAMAEQYARLGEFRKKLEMIDCANWTIPEKVDYEILKAEIKG